MIQATELRVGNMLVNPHGEIQRIFNLNDDGMRIHKHPTIKINATGVKLTPKILSKCGFEYCGRYAFAKTGYRIYRRGKIEFMQVKKGDPFTLAKYETKVSYLHTLQNLYFALTGIELEINL